MDSWARKETMEVVKRELRKGKAQEKRWTVVDIDHRPNLKRKGEKLYKGKTLPFRAKRKKGQEVGSSGQSAGGYREEQQQKLENCEEKEVGQTKPNKGVVLKSQAT